MDTTKINLLVFDTNENFKETKNNLGEENYIFKSIKCVENLEQFSKEFGKLNEDEFIFLVVHVFYTDKIKGIKRFIATNLQKKYPKLGCLYISEGDTKEIKKQLIDNGFDVNDIYKYHQIQSIFEEEKINVFQKKDILKLSGLDEIIPDDEKRHLNTSVYPKCNYAIITALEEDEMEKIIPFIVNEGTIKHRKHLIEYGHLKNNPTKKIVYASQQATGMVDASILATELILKFKPEYLIMAGVLGGRPNQVSIADVIVASNIFTIDKGKISDLGFKHDLETSSTESSIIALLKRKKKEIKRYIDDENLTRDSDISIHFGSIACVRQVIDLPGFFDDNIATNDRKALALEMESYGIARACELLNDGNTTPLIIKSVMDNTQEKTDNAKKYAAWTSATFIRYILEKDLI